MPNGQSVRPRMDFHLEHLSKDETTKFAKKYSGGNVARLLNLATEYFVLCQLRGDKGLQKFLDARSEFESQTNPGSMEKFLEKLSKA